jgi:predicted Zn-dependent protease
MSALDDAEQEFQRAAAELEAVIASVPDDPHYRESLAAVLTHTAWLRCQTGDSSGCRGSLQHAIELLDGLTSDFPGTARFGDNLAWLLASGPAEDLRDLPRAASLALRATQLVPDNKFYWRTLGTVQFRMREWAGARESLRRADELRPTESGITDCVQAMVAWQLGDREAARSLLDDANAWSDLNRPGDDELQRFREEAASLIGAKAAVAE